MKRTFLYLTFLILCSSCNNTPKTHIERSITESIAILEIYLEDSVAVNQISNLLRDTLELPVEWEPFDLFGNKVVYDAAFYLGNTTLELLAVDPPDSTIREQARFNRILFHSENIDSTSLTLTKTDIAHQTPSDFWIFSNNSNLKIGRQINLDSISILSNINIAFWEYVNSGYNFTERTIKGETFEDLGPKLNDVMISNPIGIIGLKEVHLTINQSAIDQWHKLLGPSKSNTWTLSEGPIISFTPSINNIGVDWITLSVRNLKVAKKLLSQKDLLATEKNKVFINPSKLYGLQIYIEE